MLYFFLSQRPKVISNSSTLSFTREKTKDTLIYHISDLTSVKVYSVSIQAIIIDETTNINLFLQKKTGSLGLLNNLDK